MKRCSNLLAVFGYGLALLGTAHCEDESCDDLQGEARRAIHAAASKADRSCSVDDDCVVVNYGVSCIDTCGSEQTSVASSAAAALEAQARAADDEYCRQFWRQGCKSISPPCTPPSSVPTSFCNQGQCVLTFVPF